MIGIFLSLLALVPPRPAPRPCEALRLRVPGALSPSRPPPAPAAPSPPGPRRRCRRYPRTPARLLGGREPP